MNPLESAPRDGTVIEVLFDGDWYRAFWSENAYDGSPYGTTGFAQAEDNLAMVEDELESWHFVAENPRSYGDPSPLRGHSLRQPIVLFGLGFGDEAKGATVDYLSATIPDALAVVRWSGGVNAAHNVRHGHRHHTFRQFGSGTFLGIPTYLDEQVVVNLPMIMAEAVNLEELGVSNPLSLMTLNGGSLVTTRIHMVLNRAREILRGFDRHGSTGVGIGETIVHGHAERFDLEIGATVGNFEIVGPPAHGDGLLTAAMLKPLGDEDLLPKLERILELQALYARPIIDKARSAAPELAKELDYGSTATMAQEILEIAQSVTVLSSEDFRRRLIELMDQGTVIFEGSQGLLLDEQWGFHPHTTWARTEPSGIVQWLTEENHQPYVLGLTRSYMTRHGAGPFPSEGAFPLDEEGLPADDNSWGRWQGELRVAPLDLPLLSFARTALSQMGVQLDGVGLSHLDAFGGEDLYPTVDGYGDSLDPSEGIYFELDGAGRFATRGSAVFLREKVLDRIRMVAFNEEEELIEKLEARFDAPVTILARGPKRIDRELVGASENGN